MFTAGSLADTSAPEIGEIGTPLPLTQPSSPADAPSVDLFTIPGMLVICTAGLCVLFCLSALAGAAARLLHWRRW